MDRADDLWSFPEASITRAARVGLRQMGFEIPLGDLLILQYGDRHQGAELLAGILAALIRVMQKSVGRPRRLDRDDERASVATCAVISGFIDRPTPASRTGL